MGKIGVYLLTMSGLLILMYYCGIVPSNTVIGIMLNLTTLSTSTLWITISVAIAAVGASALIIGALAPSKPELFASSTVAVLLFALGTDFIAVYNNLIAISLDFKPLLIMLFAPLMILFILSVFEWWRGITT